jgi:ribulose kinase
MLARDSRPIVLNRPAPDHAEQDSDDIWHAVCAAARAARAEAGLPAEAVAGISFDATYSLVALAGPGGCSIYGRHRAADEIQHPVTGRRSPAARQGCDRAWGPPCSS